MAQNIQAFIDEFWAGHLNRGAIVKVGTYRLQQLLRLGRWLEHLRLIGLPTALAFYMLAQFRGLKSKQVRPRPNEKAPKNRSFFIWLGW